MIGYLHIVEVIVCLIYGLIFVGCGLLVKRYPTTISGINTMPQEKRDRLDLEKIGRFCAKWLNLSAAVVFLGMWIPKVDLRWQVITLLPIFLILLGSAYMIKYRETRFKKEE